MTRGQSEFENEKKLKLKKKKNHIFMTVTIKKGRQKKQCPFHAHSFIV